MSLLSKNSLTIIFKTITLPLGIVAALSGNSANALTFTNNNQNDFSFSKVAQSIAQYEPPEVIIDDNPNSSNTSTRRNTDARFTCEVVNGEYTVMYSPESRPNRSFPWATPGRMGGGWTPQNRCNEITRRLESYRGEGLLEMSTGVENGYNTICVTTQVDPTDCKIVLTVPPGQDPQLTRDLVFDNLLIADDGQQTQGVYTYGETGGDLFEQVGSIIGELEGNNSSSKSPESIDLRPFLDRADGGTGELLGKSKSRKRQAVPSSNQSQPSEDRKPSIFQ